MAPFVYPLYTAGLPLWLIFLIIHFSLCPLKKKKRKGGKVTPRGGNQGSSDTRLSKICTSISFIVWILVNLCYIIHNV